MSYDSCSWFHWLSVQGKPFRGELVLGAHMMDCSHWEVQIDCNLVPIYNPTRRIQTLLDAFESLLLLRRPSETSSGDQARRGSVAAAQSFILFQFIRVFLFKAIQPV